MSDNKSIVPSQLNPELSPQMRQEVDFFSKWGYLVVENALSEEQLESLQSAFDEMYERHDVGFVHQLLEEEKLVLLKQLLKTSAKQICLESKQFFVEV